MTKQIADRFRRESLLLIGDAAHRFPHRRLRARQRRPDGHVVWRTSTAPLGADRPRMFIERAWVQVHPHASRRKRLRACNHDRFDGADVTMCGVIDCAAARVVSAALWIAMWPM
ncbi:hypothetical protein [Mycobacterium sp. ACS1612]|uniref:hypothetical protein n=1 Tax=Mycobacterium sp. ACS1612 TaxID=1834117 RepID=UPI001E2EFAB0|nr:hypothetical protein [Mycobacterium sp. ACS1612]